MTAFQYLVLAYALIWALLALYLFFLGRRVGRIGLDLDELRRRLERK